MAIANLLLFFAALKRFDLYIAFYVLVVPLTRQVVLHSYISNGLTLILAAAYVIRKVFSRDLYVLIPPRRITLAVAAYIVVLSISTALSTYQMVGLQRVAREGAFFLSLIAINDSIRTKRSWWQLVLAVSSISLVASLSVVTQAITHPDLMGSRLAGIFGSSTAAGLAISVTFPILLGVVIGRWRECPRYRVLLAIPIGLVLFAALLTISRSTLFVIFLAVALAARKKIPRHPYIWLGIALGIVSLLGALMLLGLDQRILAYLRIERGLSGRGYLWQRAWAIGSQHPLFGTGPSTFRYYVLPPEVLMSLGSVGQILALHAAGQLDPAFYYVDGLFGGVIGNSAHNILLGTLAEIGWIGLVAVLAIFWAGWKRARQMTLNMQNSQQTHAYWVLDGCTVAIVAQFLRMQFEDPGVFGGSVAVSLPFWAIIIIVIRAGLFLRRPDDIVNQSPNSTTSLS